MKVLLVLNHFLPEQTAGTEIYSWALAKQLQTHDIDVEVIFPNYQQTVAGEYAYDGIKVHQFPEPSRVDRSLIMGFRESEGLKYFEAYILNSKPDIIHFQELAGSNGISLSHIKAAKRSGAKILMTFHLAGNSCRTGTLVYKDKSLCEGRIDLWKCSSCYLHSKGNNVVTKTLLPISGMIHKMGIDSTKWQNKIGTALGTVSLIARFKDRFNQLIDLCDGIVVLTRWYERVLHLNGVPESKIHYIPQGLPFAMNRDGVINFEKHSGPIRLLFIGRISPFKGLHILIDALAELPEGKIQLDIYGQVADDNYAAACRKKTIGMTNIQWKGILPQAQVVTAMKSYDALCLCSTFSEMSPLVIQEAFAAGIPVIASNVYGNAEQVRHGENGLLFRFKDAASLREQLLCCIDDPGLLPKLKSNITPPRSFSLIGDEHVEMYKYLLS